MLIDWVLTGSWKQSSYCLDGETEAEKKGEEDCPGSHIQFSSQCPLTGTSLCQAVHCRPHPLWSPGARQASLLTFMLVDTARKVKWGVMKLGSRHSVSGQPAVKQMPFRAHSLAPPQVCSWAEWHPQSSRPVIRGSWQTLLFHPCSHALSI